MAARKKSLPQIQELKETSLAGVFLDLGCGYGRIAQYLLPQRTFLRYIGLDSSLEMLKIFRNRYKDNLVEQTTPLSLVLSDIDTLPLEDNSVDTVVVAAVFLHNHKSITKKSIVEVSRVLKPGGKLFVYSSFPNKFSLMGLQGIIYQFGLDFFGHSHKNGPVRYYGKKEIRLMLQDFSDIENETARFCGVPKAYCCSA